MCQYSQQNLSLILKRDFNWKMLFNPDPSKQAQEAFSEKKRNFKFTLPWVWDKYQNGKSVISKTPLCFTWYKAEFQAIYWQCYNGS